MVGYNKNQNRRVVDPRTSEETRPDHAIGSSVKLPLGRDILKKNKNNKKKRPFLAILESKAYGLNFLYGVWFYLSRSK